MSILFRRLAAVVITSIGLFIGLASPAWAQAPSFTLTNLVVTCVQFENPDPILVLGINYSMTVNYQAGGNAFIWYGDELINLGASATSPTAVTGTGSLDIFTGIGFGPATYPYDFIITIRMYSEDTNFDNLLEPVGTILDEKVLSGECVSPGETSLGGANSSAFFNPQDGRIHPDAAAPFAAYCTEWGLHVYGVNADGQGWLAFTVDTETMNAETPAQNTVIAEAENIRLYQLTSGDFQINAGPDAEGKVYVLAWNGCPVEYSSAGTLDPFSGETIPIDARKY